MVKWIKVLVVEPGKAPDPVSLSQDDIEILSEVYK